MDIVKSALYPQEIWAILKFLVNKPAQKLEAGDEKKAQCYHFLNLTSRSFAAVVQALDEELRDPICVFYLVLRGLDTVEDDMTIPRNVKVPLLRSFHQKLYEKGFQFHENGEQEKDRVLLQNFDVVVDEFLKLKPAYQDVIAEICKLMGNGMADFADHRKVDTKADWDLYCYYVAGLVGIGLCRMFASSGLEDNRIARVENLANSMGLFLQKVNIIRDYLEDLIDGRTFWPEEIWKQYGETLDCFTKPENKSEALNCLNHLIGDALMLIPDCLEFMSMLRNDSVFRFCAIPQTMAIATLAECFDNYKVFETNVKIRKGLALYLIEQSSDFKQVIRAFERFCSDISRKLRMDDKNSLRISLALGKADAAIQNYLKPQEEQIGR